MGSIPAGGYPGFPAVAAVELAHTFGITLIGFTRSDGFNIYTHSERVLRMGRVQPATVGAELGD